MFEKTHKYLRTTLIIACIATMVITSGPAGAITVIRGDSGIENSTLAEMTAFFEYLKSQVYSLKSGIAVDELMNYDFDEIKDMLDLEGTLDMNLDTSLKSMASGLENYMANIDPIEKMTDPGGEKVKEGNFTKAAEDVVTDVRSYAEEYLGSEGNSSEEQDLLDSGIDGNSVDMSEEGIKIWKNTIPLSMPGAQEIATREVITKTSDALERYYLLLNTTEKSRTLALKPITKILVKYDGEGCQFSKDMENLLEETKKTVEDAQETLQGPCQDEGAILSGIAHMQMHNIAQIAHQNKIMLHQASLVADEIRLLGYSGLLQVEPYTQEIKKGMNGYMNLLEGNVTTSLQ